MNEPRPIAEEDNVHLEWYERAKSQTLETLPAFMNELATAYKHDYGTIVHALAASAVAACWAMNAGPQGGITGFQSGAVFWEFTKHWHGVTGPARLLRYDNALYPQYADSFTSVSPETWEWMQEEAKKRLGEKSEGAHPAVIAHWQSVANGQVPFGLLVREA